MSIDFNSLPGAIEHLTLQIESIKKLLSSKKVEPLKQEKILDFKGAQAYVSNKKIPMSKSRLYKLVSGHNEKIPVHRAGNRLIFYTDELDIWCNDQITDNKPSLSTMPTIKSAYKQIKK